MANAKHVAILRRGVTAWNRWRLKQEDDWIEWTRETRLRWGFFDLRSAELSSATLTRGNFSGTDLSGANLSGADLSYTDLGDADLTDASLSNATLENARLHAARLWRADLSAANLIRADLTWADFTNANLPGAKLGSAEMTYTDLTDANLSGANLLHASLIKSTLTRTNLDGCWIFGLSVWGVDSEDAIQTNMIITGFGEPVIRVDRLDVAQFLYLMLRNQRLRDVIDTITSKVVLVLGRFTPARKAVLDMIRTELRQRGWVPVLFDFDKPASRDMSETIRILAGMSRFIIADITDAKSIPQELSQIVPDLPSVPIQPLVVAGQEEYAMFEHFRRYPWVLPPCTYENEEDLRSSLDAKVISPAEAKADEIAPRR